jgi:hypothetical protein
MADDDDRKLPPITDEQRREEEHRQQERVGREVQEAIEREREKWRARLARQRQALGVFLAAIALLLFFVWYVG